MRKYELTNGKKAMLQHNLRYLSERVADMRLDSRWITKEDRRDIVSITRNMPFPLAKAWKMQTVNNQVLIPKNLLWLFSTRHIMHYALKTFNPYWFVMYYKDLINKTTLRVILTASAFKGFHIPVTALSKPNFKWYLHCLAISQGSDATREYKIRKNGGSK